MLLKDSVAVMHGAVAPVACSTNGDSRLGRARAGLWLSYPIKRLTVAVERDNRIGRRFHDWIGFQGVTP